MNTQHSTPIARSWQARAVLVGSVLAAMMLAAVTVVTTSRAAFSDTAGVADNIIASGSVILTDDSTGTLMYNVSDAVPGVIGGGAKCINVTYEGSLEAAVRMYGSSSSVGDSLDAYLDLEIDIGSGATGGSGFDCTGFVSDSQLLDGTVAGFVSTNTNFDNGLTGWAAANTNDTKSYRILVTLQDDGDAQNRDTQLTFTWEAQNN